MISKSGQGSCPGLIRQSKFQMSHLSTHDPTSVHASDSSAQVCAKDNPFIVQRTDAIPFDFHETPFANIESFADHAAAHHFRGAILGQHGRGKTTLLCGLASHLNQQSIDCELVFFPREKESQAEAIAQTYTRGQNGAIVLVDGFERLGFLARQRMLIQSRSFSGFIATTHRPGRLATLVHCRTSQQTLISVLESLGQDQPEILAAAAPLLSQHRGNVRFVLRELYDQFADGKIG